MYSGVRSDAKLGALASRPKGRAAIQGDLGRLGEWANRNLTKLSEVKCQVLHHGGKSLCHTTSWGWMGWGAALWKKPWGGAQDRRGQTGGGSAEGAVGLEHLPCEERLRKLGWVSLEKGWLLGAPNMPRRGHQRDGAELLTVVHWERIRDNGHKLKQGRFGLDVRKTFFPMSTVRQIAQRSCVVSILGCFQDPLSNVV
ncbi:hypothetical protein QYF61_018133 [Mycteria americana]|uniref:Rna-directed dna polymerase from mobile element jockey-like n=1 Tax=Mycteria americana TaxID=33587 RepID=A0AAN7Q507_MYCAM|nr:hypothetical protein QYF61_018133 [Mycteria americana]